MRKIIVISICDKKRRNSFHFHFRGVYLGFKIQDIVVTKGNFIVGEAYLMALNNIRVEKNTIYAECIKSKKVF